jgi:hypothetical protein
MGQRASAECFDNPFLVICPKDADRPGAIFEGNFKPYKGTASIPQNIITV